MKIMVNQKHCAHDLLSLRIHTTIRLMTGRFPGIQTILKFDCKNAASFHYHLLPESGVGHFSTLNQKPDSVLPP